ncbi:MAG TPA: hypothetical protein VGN22_02065, partial [Pseudonocardia sp.]
MGSAWSLFVRPGPGGAGRGASAGAPALPEDRAAAGDPSPALTRDVPAPALDGPGPAGDLSPLIAREPSVSTPGPSPVVLPLADDRSPSRRCTHAVPFLSRTISVRGRALPDALSRPEPDSPARWMSVFLTPSSLARAAAVIGLSPFAANVASMRSASEAPAAVPFVVGEGAGLPAAAAWAPPAVVPVSGMVGPCCPAGFATPGAAGPP